ncbi:hypothetical protein SAMN04488020_10385 [Palleronia marisminoris]|uniref:Uncharacterized protein n=1 Tax=Palleronia marisminoris TaxID=315423 RepID=A0A1Y5S6B1_9RHOB|nr:hypothetical protein [Palleronia marisminoris]SFG64771.1 hypothetical protein SAMN04488020_10385 [Palleronia marisminoris]SLN33521.1 hypothetical protein PAM7066_01366 [Palleronia marisminoris]
MISDQELMKMSAAVVRHPTTITIVYDERGIAFFVEGRQFDAVHGKHALNKRELPTFDKFIFDMGQCEPHVRLSEEGVELSSVAVTQLLVWYGKANGNEFSTDDLARFFEGNDLNSVQSFWENVAIHIFLNTPLDQLPKGQSQRLSVMRERTRHADYWNSLLRHCEGVKVKGRA